MSYEAWVSDRGGRFHVLVLAQACMIDGKAPSDALAEWLAFYNLDIYTDGIAEAAELHGCSKFEGENVETRYFYARSTIGEGETLDEGEDWRDEVLEVSADERTMFDAPVDARWYALHLDSDGFVSGRWWTQATRDTIEAEIRIKKERDDQ